MTIEYKITKMIRITMEDEGCTSLCRQRDTPPRCSYNRAWTVAAHADDCKC
jgi:hypothetical protein